VLAACSGDARKLHPKVDSYEGANTRVMSVHGQRPSRLKKLLWSAGAIAALGLAVWLVRSYVPSEWTSAQNIGRLMRSVHAHPLGPLAVCCFFAALASAFVPVTALITATALVFDPAQAFAYSMAGALLSAAFSRVLGQLASGPVQRRMRGPKSQKFREQLHSHAFSATVAARILPLGNFAAINLLAGSLAVPWLPFLLGNIAGMSFGIAALTLLTDRFVAVFSAPTPLNIAVTAALLLLVLAASIALSRAVARRRRDVR